MSAIVPGDLVMAVHAHCDRAADQVLGLIKRVASIEAPTFGSCPYCRTVGLGPYGTIRDAVGRHYPLPWVRKIEPLPESEQIHVWEVTGA